MIYDLLIPQFTKMLRNLDAILSKGEAYAETKKFDMSVLLQSRLVPDQLPLTKQIQIACDTMKIGVSRVTGKDAPVHEDNETTVAELHQRIQAVISYLSTFSEKDFAQAHETKVTTPRWDGKWMYGHEFAMNHLIPNAYFHVTMTYAILRHNGVDIGKKDFLGELPFKMP